MNTDSDEDDRYDSSVYSDDESFLNQKDDDFYFDEEEEEVQEEFSSMIKKEPQKLVIERKIDVKVPEINPWTKKPNETKEAQAEPVMSFLDIIKQQEVEKQEELEKKVELEKRKKEDSKKPKSILLNRKSNNQNNKMTGFRKRTFQFKTSS